MAGLPRKILSMAGILLFKVNILKTVYFNLKYLPLRQAMRLPFFIYYRTKLFRMDGRIIVNLPFPPPPSAWLK